MCNAYVYMKQSNNFSLVMS